ncbi:MAG: L,D-peptidoglycan transpeptidase YkuD (ErfK/YbiS/YcfS/YnhG family) [Myxococcota bacterium]
MTVLAIALAIAGPLTADTQQLLLATSPDADSSHAVLTRWERTQDAWTPIGDPIPTRLGREGVAWGRGAHDPQEGLQKVEGDWRAPMGAFALGDVFGADDAAPQGATWPYIHVTTHDLFIEDGSDPHYNQHVVAPGEPGSRPLSEWEQRHQMRQDDEAHALKMFIAHNANPAVPGAGSAIFFHVWRRDGDRPTAGCTAMARPDLEATIAWLRADARPVYVLLTQAERARLSVDWGLPAP